MFQRISRLLLPLSAVLACCSPVQAQSAPSAANLATVSQSFRHVSRRVLPSVVAIRVSGFELSTHDSRGTRLMRLRGEGSGVVVRDDGTIVTNAHVVEGAQHIFVRVASSRPDSAHSVLTPESPWRDATLVGVDQETDIAVLRVEGPSPPALPLANSQDLEPGQLVLALGSPLGFDSSVSLGIVSSAARPMDPDSPMVYVQTDAAINPGSSGGPLVDAAGRVVGINTFIISESGGSDGLGFAVPSSVVAAVVDELCEVGYVRRRTLGLRTQSITPELARGLGLSRDSGVIVADVFSAVAEQTDIRVGDVVLALHGKPMENVQQFAVNQYWLPLGAMAQLTIQRDEQVLERTLPVLEKRRPAPAHIEGFDHQIATVHELGVVVADCADGAGPPCATTGMRPQLVVVAPAPGVLLEGTPFQLGDRLLAVNGQPVATRAQLRRQLLHTDAPWVLQVLREDGLRFLVVGR